MAKKLNPFTDILPKVRDTAQKFLNPENLRSLQIGFGAKVFRGDDQGIWLGAEKFADAPFSVDMKGNIVATGLSLGGLSGNLGDIADGGGYGKVALTNITAGNIVLQVDQNLGSQGIKVITASSGARAEMLPDANTGLRVVDDVGSDVFKCLVGGADVGDVIIGDFAGGKGVKWDKSAATLTIAGIIQSTSGYFGNATNGVNIGSLGLAINGNGTISSDETANPNVLITTNGLFINQSLQFTSGGASANAGTIHGVDVLFTLNELIITSNAQSYSDIRLEASRNIIVDGDDLIPANDNTQSLGNADKGWKTVYVGVGGRNFDDDGSRLTASSDFLANGSLHATGNVFTGGISGNTGSVNCGQVGGANGDVFFNLSGRIQVNNHFDPDTAGTRNLGGATRYWNDVSYKTLTDRGCLGWFDNGVEMQDGTIVSDIEAIKRMRKHPTKKTIYGVEMLDYKSFPKVSYVKAKDEKGRLLARDHNDEPYYRDRLGIKQIASDGVEMTSVFSIMIGAFKELNARIEILENEILKQKTKQSIQPKKQFN